MLTDPQRIFFALALAWLLALIMGWWYIPVLRRLRAGQAIRSVGPRTHLSKAGTPTMGGVIFALPAAVVTLLLAPRTVPAWWATAAVVLTALGHGAVGYADDFVKVVLHRSLGLRAREKLLLQTVLALVLAWAADRWLGLGTAVTVPWLGWTWHLGPYYYPFILFLVFGFANAVNLTDGLDGLLGGASVIVFAFYALVAWLQGSVGLAVFAAAVAGACGGFLRFNSHPAQVFMGDVGSLFLGGALVGLAVLTRTELLLPVVGLLFLLEALSVIIQVLWFRLTGRRIFRMSPLHHHFELQGWSEPRVLRWFWLIALVGAVLAWSALPPYLTGGAMGG